MKTTTMLMEDLQNARERKHNIENQLLELKARLSFSAIIMSDWAAEKLVDKIDSLDFDFVEAQKLCVYYENELKKITCNY